MENSIIHSNSKSYSICSAQEAYLFQGNHHDLARNKCRFDWFIDKAEIKSVNTPGVVAQ
jgi:hypothetical protein